MSACRSWQAAVSLPLQLSLLDEVVQRPRFGDLFKYRRGEDFSRRFMRISLTSWHFSVA